MTRAQFLALLSTAGVAFVGGAAISYRAGPPASAVFVHGLRLEAARADGGGAERIEAYVTRTTDEGDGGLDFEDLGPQSCTRQDGGSVAEAVQWASQRCPLTDGGLIVGAYVVEARPAGGPDDGGVGDVALEVYGTNGAARCTVGKLLAFRRFVGALDCSAGHRRARADPL